MLARPNAPIRSVHGIFLFRYRCDTIGGVVRQNGRLIASNARDRAYFMSFFSLAALLASGIRRLAGLPVDQNPRQLTQTRETQFAAVGDDLHRPGKSPRQSRMTPVNAHHIAFRWRGLMGMCIGFVRWIHAPTVGQANLPFPYRCANRLRVDGRHVSNQATVAARTG